MKIDNTSVFVPGGGGPQYGFRRTELIAQKNGSSSALDAEMETGISVFHFSIKADLLRPLNYNHEYQIVFIEPSDGTHVFGIQLGGRLKHRCCARILTILSNRVTVHESHRAVASSKCPFIQSSGSCFGCSVHNSVPSHGVAQLRDHGRLGEQHVSGVILDSRRST